MDPPLPITYEAEHNLSKPSAAAKESDEMARPSPLKDTSEESFDLSPTFSARAGAL